LGAKGGRCVRLTTLPPSCAVVMKSGNCNFLESSGPLQACSGTALPFPMLFLQRMVCVVLLHVNKISRYSSRKKCIHFDKFQFPVADRVTTRESSGVSGLPNSILTRLSVENGEGVKTQSHYPHELNPL
jgi:hypothetical protein